MGYPREPSRSNACIHHHSLSRPSHFFPLSYLNPSVVRFYRYHTGTRNRTGNTREVHLILSCWERDQRRTNEAELKRNLEAWMTDGNIFQYIQRTPTAQYWYVSVDPEVDVMVY